VNFKVYIQILNALEINWVFRTDNDISKIPRKENQYWFAGIKRGLTIYKEFYNNSDDLNKLIVEKESLLSNFEGEFPPEENIKAAEQFIELLEDYDIFLSKKDLETDLCASEIKHSLIDYFETSDEEEIIVKMQKNKATFMYSFLNEQSEILSTLKNNEITSPLLRCKEIAEHIEIM
jgi:putative ATP-dependent endonuclease of the OLD family